jgi:hypothetical protein
MITVAKASVVFTRKPDGSSRIRYNHLGVNVINGTLVEPLTHVDAMLDETRALSGLSDSTSPSATIRLGSGKRIGGRRTFVLNFGHLNGRSCRLGFRDYRLYLCETWTRQ